MRAALLVLLTGCRIGFDTSPLIAPDDGAISGDIGDGAAPAITAVQSTPLLSVNLVGPYTVAFPSATTAGNTIVVFAWSWAQGTTQFGPTGVTDNYGNPYGLLATISTGVTLCSGGMGGAALYAAPLTAGVGTGHQVYVTTTGDALQELAIVAVEYAGMSTDSLIDADSLSTSGPSTLTFDAGTVTTADPDTLLVTVATICGGYPDPVTWTNPGLTVRGVEPASFERPPGIGGDRMLTTTGTVTETWTVEYNGGTTVPGLGIVAALR